LVNNASAGTPTGTGTSAVITGAFTGGINVSANAHAVAASGPAVASASLLGGVDQLAVGQTGNANIDNAGSINVVAAATASGTEVSVPITFGTALGTTTSVTFPGAFARVEGGVLQVAAGGAATKSGVFLVPTGAVGDANASLTNSGTITVA